MSAEHTSNRANILETLFDPVYRNKFIGLMRSRLARYGARLSTDPQSLGMDDGTNMVKVVLNDIASASQAALSAGQVLVALFTGHRPAFPRMKRSGHCSWP